MTIYQREIVVKITYCMCGLTLLILSAIFNVSAGRSFLEDRFTEIYNKRFWQYNEETVSGSGSSLEYTTTIRKLLPEVLSTFEIRSILDAACGDFNWMQRVVSSDVHYIGVDIVGGMIEKNKEKYAKEHIVFLGADITKDALPRVDLILCRDCFAHLSLKDTFRALRNFKESGSKYLLTTTYINPKRENKNISNVGYENYPINLEKPPFNFPKPLYIINEKSPYSLHDKCLALWKLEDLDVESKSAVTYPDEWGGRLGDNLLIYIKARWVAHQMGIPFYYKPFKYSDKFMMHELDEQWNSSRMEDFLYVENICEKNKRYRDLYINVENYIKKDEKILYVIHYFFHPYNWGSEPELYDSQEISMWKNMMEDVEFRRELKKVLHSRTKLTEINFPKDRITVAVHIRKGGGYDGKPLLSLQEYNDGIDKQNDICHCRADRLNYMDKAYPLKFPPDAYYINQIKRISEMFDHAPMYVHIFTDDQDPVILMQKYKKAVACANIEFGCREKGNHHDQHVLEDLFAMATCDCLIRSGSNFPQIAQLIGNHKVVIYPKSAQWKNVLLINDVGVTQGDS